MVFGVLFRYAACVGCLSGYVVCCVVCHVVWCLLWIGGRPVLDEQERGVQAFAGGVKDGDAGDFGLDVSVGSAVGVGLDVGVWDDGFGDEGEGVFNDFKGRPALTLPGKLFSNQDVQTFWVEVAAIHVCIKPVSQCS